MTVYDLGPLQILNIATTDSTKRAAYGDDINPVIKLFICLVVFPVNKIQRSYTKCYNIGMI